MNTNAVVPFVSGGNEDMEQLNTHYVEFTKNPNNLQMRVKPLSRPTAVVRSGISELDELTGGLPIGKVTAFVGRSTLLLTLLHRVCVNTFDLFHSPTIVLDAGNQLNPFLLARFARVKMLSSEELLKQVYLSRTCTVYQLTDLIHSHVESLIQRVNPVTIVLTGLFSLVDDADVDHGETSQLLQMVMKKLKQMTTMYQVAMILIDRTYGECEMAEFDGLVDTTIRVQDMCHCPRITITQKNQHITVTSETVGQLSLQDFGMVM
jgi:hypothetical protein